MGISQAQIDRLEYVPNKAFRETVEGLAETNQINLQDLAFKLGMRRVDKGRLRLDGTRAEREVGDTTRLKRALGITKHAPKRGSQAEGARQMYIQYDLAVEIVKKLDLWPVDYDI